MYGLGVQRHHIWYAPHEAVGVCSLKLMRLRIQAGLRRVSVMLVKTTFPEANSTYPNGHDRVR